MSAWGLLTVFAPLGTAVVRDLIALRRDNARRGSIERLAGSSQSTMRISDRTSNGDVDRGALGLSDDMRVIVSAQFTSRTSTGRSVYDFQHRMLHPRPARPCPPKHTSTGTPATSSKAPH